FGQSTNLVAQVTSVTIPVASLSGVVRFYDGATLIGTKTLYRGKATLAMSKLTAGDHSLTAVVEPTVPLTLLVSHELTHVVQQADTTVTVSSSKPTAAFAQSVVIKAS